MKRAIIFALVLIAAVVGLYYAQMREPDAAVSPNAVVNMVADAQRDIARAPMQLTRISDEDEIRIGNELASTYVAYQGKLTPQQQAYETRVRWVGARLASHAHRKLPYTFHLVPGIHFMNAFALPGGHIFIGEALIDAMMTEDELASVLGHELEHIDHYHCAERVQVEAHMRKLHLGVLGEIAQLPVEVWQIGYSKDQEAEADREGILLEVASGYSPYGAVTMFKKLQALEDEDSIHARTPGQEVSQVALETLRGYFRSHPLASERLQRAESLIQEKRWKDRTQQKPLRINYEVRASEETE